MIPEPKVNNKLHHELSGSVLNFEKLKEAGFSVSTMKKAMTVKKMQAIQMRVIKTLIPKINQKHSPFMILAY
jgi:hypothetical protein